MSTKLLTNLHTNLQAQIKGNEVMNNIMQKIGDISAKMPKLLSNVEGVVLSQYQRLRKRVGKKLRKQSGKRSRLALQFLGWRTLEELLDAAFCGREVDVIS